MQLLSIISIWELLLLTVDFDDSAGEVNHLDRTLHRLCITEYIRQCNETSVYFDLADVFHDDTVRLVCFICSRQTHIVHLQSAISKLRSLLLLYGSKRKSQIQIPFFELIYRLADLICSSILALCMKLVRELVQLSSMMLIMLEHVINQSCGLILAAAAAALTVLCIAGSMVMLMMMLMIVVMLMLMSIIISMVMLMMMLRTVRAAAAAARIRPQL